MKSSKQRRAEIKTRRKERAEKRKRPDPARTWETPIGSAVVNPELLRPSNSYGFPLFQERGYYLDTEFTCKDCGKTEIWTATQQKWWYEVAKGEVFSCAVRCRACRRRERERQNEARRVHLEGIARKSSKQPQSARDGQETTDESTS